MVSVVTNPTFLLTKYDAPIARPSVKLWVKSAARFKYPATLIEPSSSEESDSLSFASVLKE